MELPALVELRLIEGARVTGEIGAPLGAFRYRFQLHTLHGDTLCGDHAGRWLGA